MTKSAIRRGEIRQAVIVTQPDDTPQYPTPDSYEVRQRTEDRTRVPDRRETVLAADFGGRNTGRIGEFPPPVYRHDRPRSSHRMRDNADETQMREGDMEPMAAHPLLHGLLQELPPRSSPPSEEWLDRWSSTARSILELLYSRDS